MLDGLTRGALQQLLGVLADPLLGFPAPLGAIEGSRCRPLVQPAALAEG